MREYSLLLVEDEETLSRALSFTLQREGYKVTWAADGSAGLTMAREMKPDLLILDLMLPKMNGLDVCRTLRQESALPILMLTAKVDEVDRVLGLEVGADDYLTKPFGMRELVARIKALPRRADRRGVMETLNTGGIEVEPATRNVRVDGRPIALRPKEFDLLTFLMRNQGIVVSREMLLERVWEYEYGGDSRTVDVHVRWLREKIERDPAKPTRLVTVRGVGYKLEG